MQGGNSDYALLESHLKALASECRLEILHKLRLPHALVDLKVTARRHREDEQPARLMARQSVLSHLQRLAEVGLVEARDASGRKEYVLNGPRLFQVLEELREVGSAARGAPQLGAETAALEEEPGLPEMGLPHLVLVHGLSEGQVYPLDPGRRRAGRGWVIGRRQDLPVPLDYDPYVSLENSEVLPDAAGHVLADLPGSRNGTWHNWRRLEPDERVALASGDIVGVGRSLLVYREPGP